MALCEAAFRIHQLRGHVSAEDRRAGQRALRAALMSRASASAAAAELNETSALRLANAFIDRAICDSGAIVDGEV